MIVVSACLAGRNCRFDKGSHPMQEIMEMVEEGKAILVCPEQLGGLPTPRPPSEIQKGDGDDVLDGKSRIVNVKGQDVTNNFIKGAFESYRIVMESGAKKAILKSRSPACGVGQIYDGSFTGSLKKGNGIASALFIRSGFKVISDEEFQEKGV
ncbi:MAG: DUF523 domain-containing protein [Candidatus Eremiobacteraeota bacterium]|nr:DUF523 domain-containing protein [Candidatus Eremiobacteraeota bacterium]